MKYLMSSASLNSFSSQSGISVNSMSPLLFLPLFLLPLPPPLPPLPLSADKC